MRKRTSRIYPDGITECNEVYAPFSDGWQYCDAIYKCDENGVMTCLWEKLAGKQLVSKPYARVVAVRYIDGITYAVLFIYVSPSYAAGYYWVARYDSDNNRWIAIHQYTKIGQNDPIHSYLAIVAAKKGMMISGFNYSGGSKKYYFTGHEFAEVDKDNLDELSFSTPTQGGFLGSNETLNIMPKFTHKGTIEDIRYMGASMIDRHGYYDGNKYYDYEGSLFNTYGITPVMKALGKVFDVGRDYATIRVNEVNHEFYKIYFRDSDGNKIYIDNSLLNDEYIKYINSMYSSSYTYGKQICPVFVQDYERIIIPFISGQYRIDGDAETDTGVYLDVFIFTGQEVFRACNRIMIADGSKARYASDMKILGAYKVGDYYVIYIREYDGSNHHTYAYAGALSVIQKIDYDMENYNPCGAMLIDGDLCFLLGDKSNIYYNRIVKISNGTATTVTIPTYAWEEQQ